MKWRHNRRGRVVHWESLVVLVIGDTWSEIAQNRCQWKQSREYFVFEALNKLLGEGHENVGVQEAAKPKLERLKWYSMQA